MTFAYNDFYGKVMFYSRAYHDNNIMFSSNRFQGEEENLLLGDMHDDDGGYPSFRFSGTISPAVTIRQNYFNNNLSYPDDTAALQLRLGEGGEIQVTNNIFYTCGSPLMVENWRSDDGEAVFLTNNVFISNAEETRIIQYNDPPGRIMMTGNKFDDNSAGRENVIYFRGYNLFMERNYFQNQEALYDIWCDARYDNLRSIGARYNWWGSRDLRYINSRIYGYHVNNTKAVVDYEPYLTQSFSGDVHLNWPCYGSGECSCQQGRSTQQQMFPIIICVIS